MSTTVRNYPRKPLSERERTIREALSRITVPTAPATIAVCHATVSLTSTSSALADVADMLFSVVNNKFYNYTFVLGLRSASAPIGVKLKVNNAAGSTMHAGTAASTFIAWSDTRSASTTFGVILTGTILPSADGVLQLQFANQDNSTTVTLMAGSTGYLVTA